MSSVVAFGNHLKTYGGLCQQAINMISTVCTCESRYFHNSCLPTGLVNLRRNVGGSNLIGSLEIKHMTSGIPIILTVYFYLASVKYCLCVCAMARDSADQELLVSFPDPHATRSSLCGFDQTLFA